MTITDKRNSLTKHKIKTYKKRSLDSIQYIAIHHSLTKEGSAEAFARYHVDHNDWPGIGYHYVIAKDGSIDFTNDHDLKTAHVGKMNKYAIGICFVGNFTIEDPTDVQLMSAARLCLLLVNLIPSIKEIKGHSEFPNYKWKQCPAFDVMEITNRMEQINQKS